MSRSAHPVISRLEGTTSFCFCWRNRSWKKSSGRGIAFIVIVEPLVVVKIPTDGGRQQDFCHTAVRSGGFPENNFFRMVVTQCLYRVASIICNPTRYQPMFIGKPKWIASVPNRRQPADEPGNRMTGESNCGRYEKSMVPFGSGIISISLPLKSTRIDQ